MLYEVITWITNETSRFEDVSNRNIVAFLDLAENQENIYNNIPQFQASPGAPLNPANNSNGLYEQLNTTYSSVRNIDQVADAFVITSYSIHYTKLYEMTPTRV